MAIEKTWRAAFPVLEPSPFPAGYWLYGAAYVALYLLLDWASFAFAYSVAGMTPWNPPPGLSLALLLRFGLGYWPFVFVATVVAEVVVRGQDSWPTLLALASIATVFYAAAAFVLGQRVGVDWAVPTLRGTIGFLLVALCATAIVASLQASLFAATGAIATGQIALAALRSWAGELSGVLVFAPLLLRLARLSRAEARGILSSFGPDTALQTAALALALWLVFGLETTDEFKFFYLLVLPVGWIALRHGFDGACSASLGIQLGTFLLVLHRGFDAATATEFQFLSLALVATALVIGASASEKTRALAALAEHRERLAHAVRINAAGEMISALAHELSQPLAAMATYIADCERQLRGRTDDAELAQSMTGAAGQAERARQVIVRLRRFLRRGEVSLAEVSAQSVLADAIALIQPEAKLNRIEIVHGLEATPVYVMADTVQLQQVVMNLIRNAVEAITDARVSVRRVEIGLRRDGDEVEISISDTGPGISPAMEATLFEPFASTKTKGMGLGLAIGRSLVEAHGGRLGYAARADGGARFTIRLPAAGRHGD